MQSLLPVARMPDTDHVSAMDAASIGISPAIISGAPSTHDFAPSRCTQAPAISQFELRQPLTFVAQPSKR